MKGGERVLVTGGAGFIGSHLVDALVRSGHRVRVLDSLVSQVHGNGPRRPAHLHSRAELLQGSVTNPKAVARALDGITAVFHLAAAVGVGQSMYRIREYTATNVGGTASLLQVLASARHRVRTLIVALSMSVYGEGAYACARCGEVHPRERPVEQMAAGEWEVRCSGCGLPANPVPTREDRPLQPTSVYGITKRDQEEMCLAVGRAYGIRTLALRFFNVYGPRQAPSNPYTGVVANFMARLLNGKPPVLFEDGCQTRDFVHVSDVVQALLLALQREDVSGRVFNVGCGRPVSVQEVARRLVRAVGRPIQPEALKRFRKGDIRHCYANIAAIRECLGYVPRVDLEAGLEDLFRWYRKYPGAISDRTNRAQQELATRGLMT